MSKILKMLKQQEEMQRNRYTVVLRNQTKETKGSSMETNTSHIASENTSRDHKESHQSKPSKEMHALYDSNNRWIKFCIFVICIISVILTLMSYKLVTVMDTNKRVVLEVLERYEEQSLKIAQWEKQLEHGLHSLKEQQGAIIDSMESKIGKYIQSADINKEDIQKLVSQYNDQTIKIEDLKVSDRLLVQKYIDLNQKIKQADQTQK